MTDATKGLEQNVWLLRNLHRLILAIPKGGGETMIRWTSGAVLGSSDMLTSLSRLRGVLCQWNWAKRAFVGVRIWAKRRQTSLMLAHLSCQPPKRSTSSCDGSECCRCSRSENCGHSSAATDSRSSSGNESSDAILLRLCLGRNDASEPSSHRLRSSIFFIQFLIKRRRSGAEA